MNKPLDRIQKFPSGWRTMWVFAMFDLPTMTPEERHDYTSFRKCLLNDGFSMLQYSVYQRFCSSPENAEMHIERMSRQVPPEGKVQFLMVTDRQFGKMRTYFGKLRQEEEKTPSQLTFF